MILYLHNKREEELICVRWEIELTLAMSLFLSGSLKADAAFNAGSRSRNISYGSAIGNVSVLADVINANGTVAYKYKGTTYLNAYVKLSNHITGYYYNSVGIVSKYTDSETRKSTTTVTAGGWLPAGCSGLCTSGYKCNSKAYVNDNYVGAVSYPL